MKRTAPLYHRRSLAAFTLIELLVVIATITILAALIFPVVGSINKRKQISLAQAQLAAVVSAIEDYHTRLGYYPPDNPTNALINPLYFELLGTTNNGLNGATPTVYVTSDGSAQISNNGSGSSDLNTYFDVSGFANTSTRAQTDDQGAAATSFLKNLKPQEIGEIDASKPLIKILLCSVSWPPNLTQLVPNAPLIGENPWRYISTHPTNNASSYDLWVDIVYNNKTNRVCNWSPQPIQL
jgi:type II secretory pathway pseudopilin PulG